tara:strand:- start:19759 stop:21042 length:1284 start_codon:yes stop_codon:yes gene_type:complete
MTKRFLPGTLNPLYENDSDFDIDLNEFNNPYYVNELQKKILESQLEQDLFAGMSSPKAIILGPAKFSYQNVDTDYAIPVHGTSNIRKVYTWYYFRIPEIHSHLTDPCNPRLLQTNRNAAYKAIYDHPIAPYISSDPNIEPPQILPGSVVEIKYDRGPNAGLGLFPKITRVMGISYGILNSPECESALNGFAQALEYGTVESIQTGGDFRKHPFDPNCVPHGQDANNPIAYFGEAGYKQIKDNIAQRESGGALRPSGGKSPPSTGPWSGKPASTIDGVNYAGYIGKYQMGLQHLMAEETAYIQPSLLASLKAAKCTGQAPHCRDTIFGLLTNPSSWTGKDGINNIEDFLNSSKAQEAVMDYLIKNNFEALDKKFDRNSPQDVAGMLAASHLLGADKAIKMREGAGGQDANGTRGSDYYSALGGKCPVA